MSRELWFRGGDETAAFDWSAEARELDVPLDVARALYLRAVRLAADSRPAEQLYLRWLRAAAAARRASAPPAAVAGRQTRVIRERGGAAAEPRTRDHRAPGRMTRVLFEAPRADPDLPGIEDLAFSPGLLDSSAGAEALRGHLVAAAASGRGAAEVLAAADPATAAVVLPELRNEHVPGRAASVLRLVTAAAGGEVERVLGRRSTGIGLPADVVARLAPHVGRDAAGAARVHVDDAGDLVATAHHAHALTVGKDIFFARGAYAPGSERGDELLVHELTHVAQGQRGELVRAAAKGIDSGGPLDAAEVEADLRARFAALQLHAPAREVPAPVQPNGGQPASPDERTARLAAQQERVTLANQVCEPLTIAPAPAITPQAPEADPATAATAPATTTTAMNAYVDVFQALPSAQAMALWDEAGTEATTQFADEQARFDAALPELPIVLEGCEAPAAADAAVGDATVSTEPTDAGATPPAAETTPTPEVPPATAADAVVETIPTTTDTAQMQADAQQALDALPTTAPDVSTDPGPAPMTELAGQADPVRMLGDQQQALTDGTAALDAALTAIVTGPGPVQIQPISLDETLAVPPADDAGAMPALPAVEGMAKFKSWNLPADVQATFDGIAQPRMDANLAQAQARMTEAQTQRDLDRARAVSDAQDQVRLAHVDADLQQQTRIAETRTRIANQQAATLLQQQAEVARLDQQAGDRRTATVTRINDRITADQATVETDFQDAQRRADERRTQGEADAAQRKQDAQDRAANQSWWDQLVGSIVDAIQSIADEINQVLDAIGEAVGQILEDVKTAACQLIDAACDFVCQELTAFGDWLKSEVSALIGTVFPELAAELNRLIDGVVAEATAAVTAIADDLKTAVTELCDGLKAAIDAAIATFKAAVDAAATFATALVTGDWSVVGKMFLDGILSLLGIDPAAFYALIGEAEDSIEKIIEDPGAFVGHLVDAVKLGFQQFGGNFLVHLQDGLVQWLTGALGGAGIQMPASFDLAGIFDLVCQVLGLTWPRLRQKVVALIGEDNTERLEFVAQYIQAFLTGGFAGLWEQVQQDLGNLWDMVVGGIQDWLIQNVVQAAILRIATMWNPVGAILQLIQTAWTTYQWLRENAQRIFGLVEAVVHSISSIVAGDISGAANLVESSLARLVPIAISLFADLIGLGGIATEIQRIIGDVQTLVDQAIDALIERVKALFRGGNSGGPDHGDPGPDEVGETIPFQADGHPHRLFVEMQGDRPVLMVASHPLSVENRLDDWAARSQDLPPEQKAKVDPLIADARARLAEATERLNAEADAETGAEDTSAGSAHTASVAAEHEVEAGVRELMELFGEDTNSQKAQRIAQAHSQPTLNTADGFKIEAWMAAFEISWPRAKDDLKYGVDTAQIRRTSPGNYLLIELTDVQVITKVVAGFRANGRFTPEFDPAPFPRSPSIVDYCTTRFGGEIPTDPERYTTPQDGRRPLVDQIIDELIHQDLLKVSPAPPGHLDFGHPLPPQRHLPADWGADTLRNTFYFNGTSHDQVYNEVENRDRDRIQHCLDLLRNPTTAAAGAAEFQALKGRGYFDSDDVWDPGPLDTYWLDGKIREVDHMPSIAEQWCVGVNGPPGNDCIWSIRRTFAVDKNHLAWTTRRYNRSQSGRGHNFVNKWWVGPNFTGPGDDDHAAPGVPYSRTPR